MFHLQPLHVCTILRIIVLSVDRYLLVYRAQGVSVSVTKTGTDRPWWLFGGTRTADFPAKVDNIRCTIVLSGLAGTDTSNSSCNSCDSLEVLGPNYWGIFVPRAYRRLSYGGDIFIDRSSFHFSGEFIFEEGKMPGDIG